MVAMCASATLSLVSSFVFTAGVYIIGTVWVSARLDFVIMWTLFDTQTDLHEISFFSELACSSTHSIIGSHLVHGLVDPFSHSSRNSLS
jgi:hypothetical protein